VTESKSVGQGDRRLPGKIGSRRASNWTMWLEALATNKPGVIRSGRVFSCCHDPSLPGDPDLGLEVWGKASGYISWGPSGMAKLGPQASQRGRGTAADSCLA